MPFVWSDVSKMLPQHRRPDDNPKKLSHNTETPKNPRRVWTFKKLEPV
jgi:hypothetical protein